MTITIDKNQLPEEILKDFEAVKDKPALVVRLLEDHYEAREDAALMKKADEAYKEIQEGGRWYTEEEVFNR